MSDKVVPPKDGEKKVALPMRVSPDLQARLEALQPSRGATSLAEVVTDALVAGLQDLEGAAYSTENKVLVNQRLKAKRDGAIEAVSRLEAIAGNLDQGADAEELRAIAAQIKTWLRE